MRYSSTAFRTYSSWVIREINDFMRFLFCSSFSRCRARIMSSRSERIACFTSAISGVLAATADSTAQLREELAGLTVDEPSDDDSDVDEVAMAAMERDLLDRMPPESFAALQAAWDEGREVSMEEFFAGLPPAPRDGDAE